MTPEVALKLLKEAQKVEAHLRSVDDNIERMSEALKGYKKDRENFVAELREIVNRESEPLLEDQP